MYQLKTFQLPRYTVSNLFIYAFVVHCRKPPKMSCHLLQSLSHLSHPNHLKATPLI